jgi:hypothetical protein
MIKFEHNMLVLNNAFSKEDVEQIDDFADYIRNEERERIIKLLTDNDYVGAVTLIRLAERIKGENK